MTDAKLSQAERPTFSSQAERPTFSSQAERPTFSSQAGIDNEYNSTIDAIDIDDIYTNDMQFSGYSYRYKKSGKTLTLKLNKSIKADKMVTTFHSGLRNFGNLLLVPSPIMCRNDIAPGKYKELRTKGVYNLVEYRARDTRTNFVFAHGSWVSIFNDSHIQIKATFNMGIPVELTAYDFVQGSQKPGEISNGRPLLSITFDKLGYKSKIVDVDNAVTTYFLGPREVSGPGSSFDVKSTVPKQGKLDLQITYTNDYKVPTPEQYTGFSKEYRKVPIDVSRIHRDWPSKGSAQYQITPDVAIQGYNKYFKVIDTTDPNKQLMAMVSPITSQLDKSICLTDLDLARQHATIEYMLYQKGVAPAIHDIYIDDKNLVIISDAYDQKLEDFLSSNKMTLDIATHVKTLISDIHKSGIVHRNVNQSTILIRKEVNGLDFAIFDSALATFTDDKQLREYDYATSMVSIEQLLDAPKIIFTVNGVPCGDWA